MGAIGVDSPRSGSPFGNSFIGIKCYLIVWELYTSLSEKIVFFLEDGFLSTEIYLLSNLLWTI